MDHEHRADPATVSAPGIPTAEAAEALKLELRGLLAAGVREVVVDLGHAETLGSAGLGVLAAAHNTLRHAGGRLRIVGAGEAVHRYLQALGLDRCFEVERP